MYPDSFVLFNNIPSTSLDPVGVELQQLTDAINAIPGQVELKITKNMYGNMEIVNDQMLIYDTLGNVIQTFNLFDFEGNPTTTSPVYKRVLV